MLFAILRDTVTSKHDFSGYVIAGELAWEHQDIYSHHLNTWPPSFSVISILFYHINSISSYATQFFWLTGFTMCYLLCFRFILDIFFDKKFSISLKPSTPDHITLMSWTFIIPFILGLRIIFEEIVNIQINIYLLTLCVLALKLALKNKNSLAGFLLAITIACKVYTLILLPLIFFRKKFKFGGYTLLWLGVILAGVFLYFGYDDAIKHHITWWQKDVITKNIFDHGNQSLGSFITGLVSNVERLEGIRYNIADISLSNATIVGYATITLLAAITGIVFLYTYSYSKALEWQYIITMSFIPLFSPISWKYYYVFLMPLTLILYVIVQSKQKYKLYYYVPLLLITLSTELVVGSRFSNVLEAYGIITLNSLALILFSLYTFKTKQFSTLKKHQ